MANVLELEGFVQMKETFDRILPENPQMATTIRKIIRDVLSDARNKVAQGVSGALPNDPHEAFRSVRRSVYKQVFGGNINILRNRRAGSLGSPLQVVRKLDQFPHQRGGNRMKMSSRTYVLQNYQGKDRGFILRFLNSGTADRNNGVRDTGALEARDFFQGIAASEIEQAVLVEKFWHSMVRFFQPLKILTFLKTWLVSL